MTESQSCWATKNS